METNPSDRLTERLQGDEALGAKLAAAQPDERREILADAGDSHHHELDDDQLDAVVGGQAFIFNSRSPQEGNVSVNGDGDASFINN
ncbi:MAG: hypothetical protein AAGF73_00025 [Actinomycetota bacterium]